MIDFLESSRQQMIDNLQVSLRAVRSLMGFSAQEIGEFIGVTRQTINNLETGKSKMTPIQYVSVCAVIDNYVDVHDEMLSAVVAIIDGNGLKQNKDYASSFHNSSLLKRWFTCFGELSDIRNMGEANKTANHSHLLNNLISGYKLFIAADSLLAEGIGSFIPIFNDCLQTAKAKAIIPLRVVEEIQQQLTDVEGSRKAVNALKIINDMQKRGIAELRGESGDTNPQDTILSVFAKFRSVHRLCLITQDKAFAAEIIGLNHASDRQGFDIIVGYIDDAGVLNMYNNTELQECKNEIPTTTDISDQDTDTYDTEADAYDTEPNAHDAKPATHNTEPNAYDTDTYSTGGETDTTDTGNTEITLTGWEKI
ncbi:MAG: hypothetical protein FWC77_02340 [Defluviitaleaceae bacterium]|nr:hypothetical protein [Defluviitaleaceae bacterium]